LRNEKGINQKDLADQLHVTFQTISKWENDENEPDFTTIKELTKIYGCSADYFFNDDEEAKAEETEEPIIEEKKETEEEKTPEVVEPTPQEVIPTVTIQKELHVCARCGKDIPEEELASEDIKKTERHGRSTRTVSVGQTYYHNNCLKELQAERAAKEEAIKAAKASSDRKKCFGWSIAGGVVSLGIALAIFLCNTQYVHPGLGVLFSVLIGYVIFADIYCILSGSYIGDVFLWCASLSIKLPGIIFSWDLSGIAFLIVMKILFAIIGFLVGVGALLLAIGLSGALAAISFPFVLVHNVHTNYEDAL
jgi:transcriptional regulator with XRE-family HTH domain